MVNITDEEIERVEEVKDNPRKKVVDYERSGPGIALTLECNNCGEEFSKGLAHVERGDGIYCSTDCSAEGRKGRAQTSINTSKEDELAYIGGLVYGDGFLKHNPNTGNYRTVFTNTSQELVDEFRSYMSKIGVNTHVTEYDGLLKAGGDSIMLYNIVDHFFTSPSGVREYIDTPEEARLFVRGFYEAEGSLERYRIRISQKETGILDVVEEIINDETEIECRWEHYGPYTNLVIGGEQDVDCFLGWTDPVIKTKQTESWSNGDSGKDMTE